MADPSCCAFTRATAFDLAFSGVHDRLQEGPCGQNHGRCAISRSTFYGNARHTTIWPRTFRKNFFDDFLS